MATVFKGGVMNIFGYLLERANLSHWTIPVTLSTAIQTPETSLS
jgi:hypothetical protein